MRLIDADALTEHMRKAYEGNKKIGFKWDLISTVAVIGAEEEITPDAQPIRHGHWISERLCSTNGGTYGIRRCSNCEYCYNDFGDKWNYCPDCGAKMDEVEE